MVLWTGVMGYGVSTSGGGDEKMSTTLVAMEKMATMMWLDL